MIHQAGDFDEEIVFKLVSEISFSEECERFLSNPNPQWSDDDFEVTKHSIKLLQDIIQAVREEMRLVNSPQAVQRGEECTHGLPALIKGHGPSSAFDRCIPLPSDFSEGSANTPRISEAATPSLTIELDDISSCPTQSGTCASPERDEMTAEVVKSVCSKLRSLLDRLRRKMQVTPDEGTLSTLLELHLNVNQALTDADQILFVLSPNHSDPLYDFEGEGVEFMDFHDRESVPFDGNFPSPSADLDPKQSLNSIIYFLRRMTDRQNTLLALKYLFTSISSSGLDGGADGDVGALKEAGVLEALLTALPRAHIWPEVEHQISMAVAVLVVYEEDQLIEKHAAEVLAALHDLQIRNADQHGTSNHDETDKAPSTSALARENSMDDLTSEIDTLVMAAVLKVTSVLCSGWSKKIADAKKGGIGLQKLAGLNTNFSSDGQDKNRLVESLVSAIVSSVSVSGDDGPSIPQIVPARRRSLSCERTPLVDNIRFDTRSLNRTSSPSVVASMQYNPKTLDSLSPAVVLASEALCTLSELAQCKAPIVSGGGLQLLRKWLEMGLSALIAVKDEAVSHIQSLSADMSISDPSWGAVDRITLKMSCELLNNCSVTLSNLLGGSHDCRWNVKGRLFGRFTRAQSKSSSGDSMASWIDSQCNLEGIPVLLVKYLTSAVECHNFLNARARLLVGNSLSESSITRFQSTCTLSHLRNALFSRAFAIHTCQSLFLLSSRAHNRSYLVSLRAPEAVISLFVHSVSVRKQAFDSSIGELSRADSELLQSSFWVETLEKRKFHQDIMLRRCARFNASLCSETLDYLGAAQLRGVMFSDFDLDNINLSMSCSHFMKAVASASLGALSYFLGDLSSGRSALTSKLSVGDVGRPSTPPSVENQKTSVNVLVDMISVPPVIEAMKLFVSLVPRSSSRLSALLVISALSSWPSARQMLFDYDFTDMLVVISSEADELKVKKVDEFARSKSRSAKSGEGQELAASPKSPSWNPAAGTSALASDFYDLFISPSSSRLSTTSRDSTSSHCDDAIVDAVHSIEDEEDDSELLHAISVEETMIVCLSLANFCQDNKQYALRIFDNGVFQSMLKLVYSSHAEICHQALRCISATCSVLSSSTSDRVGSSRQSKSELYVQILEVLTAALRSVNPLMQKEAVCAISRLSPDESIHHDIMSGPFKAVIRLMLDHSTCEVETRSAAENMLVGLGFALTDLDLCYHNAEVMIDWFYLRKSLQPQQLANQLLLEWIGNLFSASRSTTTTPGSARSESTRGTPGETIVRQKSDSAASSSYHDAPSPSSLSFKAFTFPSLNVSERLIKLIPLCLGRQAAMAIIEEENMEAESHLSTPARDTSSRSIGSTSSHSCDGLIPSAVSDRYLGSFCSTRGDYYGLERYYSHQLEEEYYPGLDSPPRAAVSLMNLFHPSKLIQLVLMDLLNFESERLLLHPNQAAAQHPRHIGFDDLLLSLPKPRDLSGIYFPPRDYSFERIRRVIEKNVEMRGEESRAWSLAFRDDSFPVSGVDLSEYYTSLMALLCKCPQIQALSFSCHGTNMGASSPEESAQLGHLAGTCPPNIRFINMRGVLSSNSIQAMCILLRKHNAAYSYDSTGDEDNFESDDQARPSAGEETETSWAKFRSSVGKGEPSVRKFPRPSRGLLGLAITHTQFTATDVEHISDLLRVYSSSVFSCASPGSQKEVEMMSQGSSWIAQFEEYCSRGIRFLDLSGCHLHDSRCADILKASSFGPLEGLDLADNNIHRGAHFLDVFARLISSSAPSRLRHLGLSNNSLPSKVICTMLDCLQLNQTLTSLDLSRNDLKHYNHTRDALRNFLKRNRGVRVLDLSHNKLTSETTKGIYLGIIENESILILSLASNYEAMKASEFTLIQNKLRDNRMRYKSAIETFNKQINRLDRPVDRKPVEEVNQKIPEGGGAASNQSQSQSGIISEAQGLPSQVPVAVPVSFNFSLALPQADASSGEVAAVDSTNSAPVGQAGGGSLEIVPTAAPVTAVTAQASSPRNRRTSLPQSSFGDSSSESFGSNSLHVFLSAPLAWRDRSNRLHPLEVLDYTSERDSLINVLREVNKDISIVFEFATTDTLRTALSFGCRALHFSGHGHPQCLNFEDGRAGLQLVSIEILRNLLRAGGLKLDFVFVSACHSRKTGEAFIEAGVPHVVCVKVDAMIEDSAANTFTRAFYLALFTGKTVQQSFDIAKQALKASPYVHQSVLEGEKFILLPDAVPVTSPSALFPDSRPPSLHDKAIFWGVQSCVWPDRPSHLCMGTASSSFVDSARRLFNVDNGIAMNSTLPVTSPDFEGREVDMYRVISTLLARRLVTITGQTGVGKSALTAAVCTYVADRGMFSDGVVYVRLQGVYSHRAFLSAVLRALSAGPSPIERELQRLKASSPDYTSAADAISSSYLSSGGADGPSDSASHQRTMEMLYHVEQLIVASLSLLKILLVIDNVDGIVVSEESCATDFKVYIGRLFDRCKHVRVLVTNTESLGLKNVSGFGVVENCVALGPLNLRSSIRLFSKISPVLLTSMSKTAFINSLLPQKLGHVTANSKDITQQTAELLQMFGNGHAAQVVKLACESTHESVQEMMVQGNRLLQSVQATVPPTSTIGPASSTPSSDSASSLLSPVAAPAAPQSSGTQPSTASGTEL